MYNVLFIFLISCFVLSPFTQVYAFEASRPDSPFVEDRESIEKLHLDIDTINSENVSDFRKTYPMFAEVSDDDLLRLTSIPASDRFSLFPPSNYAQEASVSEDSSIANCFDHYTFGSVEVRLTAMLPGTVSGTDFLFSGTLVNKNPYPVVDGSVYVKIFKKTSDGVLPVNGYDVVDQFTAVEGLNLQASEERQLQFPWRIPAYLPSGEYQAAFFFVSAQKFNMLGLPFTDDVVGNTVDFSITGDMKDMSVVLNKSTVTVGASEYRFASFPPVVDESAPILVEVDVVNNLSETRDIPVTWSVYRWDQQREENKVEEKTSLVSVPANGTQRVSYVVTDATSSVYVVVASVAEHDIHSILNIRFVRKNVPTARINYVAVTDYPLKKDTRNTLFACVHGSGTLSSVPEGKVLLVLKDATGEVIHEYVYEGTITGRMMGLVDNFTPLREHPSFILEATLYLGNNIVDTVTMSYTCADFGLDCPSTITTTPVPTTTYDRTSLTISAGLLIILIFILMVLVLQRKQSHGLDASTPLSMVWIIIASCLFLVPAEVGATKSVVWSSGPSPLLAYFWNQSFASGVIPLDTTPDCYSEREGTDKCGWAKGLGDAVTTVTYKARLIDDDLGNEIIDGSDVPVGTKIRVDPIPGVREDISWFGTGYSAGSPYGRWVPNAGPVSTGCDPSDYVHTVPIRFWSLPLWYNVDSHILLNVHYPDSAISASANVSCVGDVCTVLAPGPVSVTREFENTVGRFYYRFYGHDWIKWNGCIGNNVPMRPIAPPNALYCGDEIRWGCWCDGINCLATEPYTLDVPSQEVTFNLNGTLALPNTNPNPPTIDGPVTGETGTPYVFTITGDDPDGDDVYYDVDWLNNGTVTGRAPLSGTLPSGTDALVSRTWPVEGTYTFQARTVDTSGAVSSWATHTIVITLTLPPNTNPNPPTIDGPVTGETGTPYVFTITGDDPDGDEVYYEVDWNGTPPYQRAPLSGTLPSGTDALVSRTWPVEGTYTFQARTVDTSGAVSSWATHTIVITLTPLIPQ